MNTNELIFTDKNHECQECANKKEINIKLGMTNNDEWEKIIPILDKHNITREETQYVYNFYNRVFNTNKQPGCGKCFVNICKQLKNRWNEINK